MRKRKLFLADLTHTGQSIASNVFPLAVGLIANYINQENPDHYEIELFKYPDDLAKALETQTPDLVGFSNYSWNCDLSYQFTKRIKQQHPETVVIWGGPNYGLTPEELNDFWSAYPLIDFYLIKEGEKATLDLLAQLELVEFDANRLKNNGVIPSNAHFLKGAQRVFSADILPRIKNLAEIGSPYLSGYMDKFFDNVLIPMVHTTRGCPFGCTFCTEGNSYYNRVSQVDNFKNELEYIAQRRKQVQDLLITDANFGMFPQDVAKADIIAELKSEYNWPQKILVSTGKNKKERVIEVAKKLDGALSIAASLQTTNQDILSTIKRSNISSDALNVIVQESKDVNTPTYTEIILALPGDSVLTHVTSLKEVINSGLGIVRMYQLILLPQTELATPMSRQKYQMETVFRINPRCFGHYFCYGERFCSVEFEEICVATNTLSKQDYLSCRQLDLSVEVLHNTGLFFELRNLLISHKIEWFDFIERAHAQILNSRSYMSNIYSDYVHDCFSNTFQTKDHLMDYFTHNHELIIGNSAGTNEMAKGKARAVFEGLEELHDIAYQVVCDLLIEQSSLTNQIALYLNQLKKISLLRKCNLTNRELVVTDAFNFNFIEMEKLKYECDPLEYYSEDTIEITLGYSNEERDYVESYFNQYGEKIEGLGRILMRINTEKLFKPIRLSTVTTGMSN
ncbi:B12-binding domain-containing radical SAM protein [Algibacillus agarilyticus]|uniref:B12-binding domain-containing radical SAM protein n=1 Tax=Algibacillus agarilyticus TaxID=2234133 RepID=UPI000DD0704B|nr:cobalamin-dependent protein [Algibacillus agarilyticus]